MNYGEQHKAIRVNERQGIKHALQLAVALGALLLVYLMAFTSH